MMNKRIACCGLDCEQCDARIATMTDDEALRERTAALWTKTPFCDALCMIRRCVREKELETCADCGRMDGCEILGRITGGNPAAVENLKRLREGERA